MRKSKYSARDVLTEEEGRKEKKENYKGVVLLIPGMAYDSRREMA